jgi:hypothetical protein
MNKATNQFKRIRIIHLKNLDPLQNHVVMVKAGDFTLLWGEGGH